MYYIIILSYTWYKIYTLRLPTWYKIYTIRLPTIRLSIMMNDHRQSVWWFQYLRYITCVNVNWQRHWLSVTCLDDQFWCTLYTVYCTSMTEHYIAHSVYSVLRIAHYIPLLCTLYTVNSIHAQSSTEYIMYNSASYRNRSQLVP